MGPQGPAGPQGDPATDDQTLQTNSSAGNISITGGNEITINVEDADADPTNEYNASVSFDGSSLTVTDAGGSKSADLSSLAYDDSQLQADVAQNTTDIASNVANISTNTSNIAVNSADIATNKGKIATNENNIANLQADVAQNSSDIAANTSDIAAHIAADQDTDPSNEVQTLSLSGTDLTISGAGGNTVTLTPLIDTNLATDNLTQDPENRSYNMNNQALGFVNGMVGIGTNTPTSRLSAAGSFSTPIRSTAVNTTLGIDDFTLIMTAKDLMISLPAANTCQGRIYVLKNTANGDNATNISFRDKKGDPETKIDKEKTLWLQSDGTNWHLINIL
jgi:hypothetical protein